jgi:HK97 family phage prohead protease
MSTATQKCSVRAVEANGDRSATAVLSRGNVDREGDVLEPLGWDLRHFRKNPVVLFAHAYRDLPIATTETIAVRGGRLTATARFPEAGVNRLSDDVLALIRAGVLNAVSVGFRPLEWHRNEHGGRTYTRQELLEWSIVPVPANPEALIQRAAARGLEATARRCVGSGCEVLARFSDRELRAIVREVLAEKGA